MRTSTTTTGHRRNNASCPLLTPQCGQSRAARAGRTAEEWRTALNWSEPVELGAFYRYAFAIGPTCGGSAGDDTSPRRAPARRRHDRTRPARDSGSAAARSASQRRSGVADRRGAGGPGFALAGSRATNDHAQYVRRLGAGNGRKPATGTGGANCCRPYAPPRWRSSGERGRGSEKPSRSESDGAIAPPRMRLRAWHGVAPLGHHDLCNERLCRFIKFDVDPTPHCKNYQGVKDCVA